MRQYDLLMRNGIVATATDEQRSDLAVADGRIVALGLDLPGTSSDTLHFLTIASGNEDLRELGRLVLWEGAQDIVLEQMEGDEA